MSVLTDRTILVVDDDADTVETYSTWLELRGARAVRGRSARDARAILGAIAVDAVITDLAMPHESGFLLAQWIRSEPALRELPLIAVSGVVAAADRARVLGSGVDAFHTKPVHPRAIEADIGALLRR